MESPHISRTALAFFRHIVRGYFRRHFRAVRVTRASNLASFNEPRLIVFANHSSWWDPMVLVLLGERMMPTRKHYAPMEADALARYGILKRIGVFGVAIESARGAAQFLRTGKTILRNNDVLWVTPQGRFADVRERPLAFKPGLAALASKVEGGCTLLPLAVEYVFWDERLPETLLHFGAPVHLAEQHAETVQQQLEAALLDAMQQLRTYAMARDASAFEVIHAGKAGTGGFYQLIQRAVAKLRGRSFQAEHTAPIQQPEERG